MGKTTDEGKQRTGRRISRYMPEMRILLVGEGDFSFAAALACAFKSAPLLVATSLDSLDTLKQNYANKFPANLKTLQAAGAKMFFGVDVGSMAQDKRLRGQEFDAIVFNFPHSGWLNSPAGEDDPRLIKRHRRLLQTFFRSAVQLLAEEGEIHVSHHLKWPYTEWKIEVEAEQNGLLLAKRPMFDAKDFPGYHTRRGAGAQCAGKVPVRHAATFIFVETPLSESSDCDEPESAPSLTDLTQLLRALRLSRRVS